MSRSHTIRSWPVVCFFLALFYLAMGRLRFPRRYHARRLVAEDGQVFTVFRHMTLTVADPANQSAPVVLAVRFRFARFAYGLNRALSILPIPLIGAYPGFRQKLWMVNEATGEWQGLYEWESDHAAESYRRSFVLKRMMRRAVNGSVSMRTISGVSMSEYMRRMVGHA